MFDFIDVEYKEIINIPALHIKKNTITTLTGPSGSGKTTILKMLNKMISPTNGRILFRGEDLSKIHSVMHRRQVTMLSQTPSIFEGTVRENLVIGLALQKRDIPENEVLLDILERIKLSKELNSSSLTLSGGEKQRLALGRVLLLCSDVYLLDEPSSALDEAAAEDIFEMITEYVRHEKKTLVMVTHAKAMADRFSDEVIEVSEGKCSRRSI